jgi:hypothetical protein
MYYYRHRPERRILSFGPMFLPSSHPSLPSFVSCRSSVDIPNIRVILVKCICKNKNTTYLGPNDATRRLGLAASHPTLPTILTCHRSVDIPNIHVILVKRICKNKNTTYLGPNDVSRRLGLAASHPTLPTILTCHRVVFDVRSLITNPNIYYVSKMK